MRKISCRWTRRRCASCAKSSRFSRFWLCDLKDSQSAAVVRIEQYFPASNQEDSVLCALDRQAGHSGPYDERKRRVRVDSCRTLRPPQRSFAVILASRMFKLIRMKKRGDKTPAEFSQEWLEKNREVRKTANKVVATVIADGKVLGDEPMYDGVAALYFNTEKEARAAEDKNLGKDAISVVADEKVLYERTGAT